MIEDRPAPKSRGNGAANGKYANVRHPQDPKPQKPMAEGAPKDDGRMAMERKIKKLERLKMQADRRRTPWLDQWQEVYDYCLPGRDGFFEKPGSAARKTDHVFDMTVVNGLPRFASRVQLGYMSPTGQNFRLIPGMLGAKEGFTFLQELDVVTELVHEVLRNSNFGSELHEGLMDLGIGTMSQRIDPGPFMADIVTTSVPATQLSLLSGPGDSIGGWFHTRPGLVLRDLIEEFPNAPRPDYIRAKADLEDLDSRHDLIEGCYRDTKEWHQEKWDCCAWVKDMNIIVKEESYTGSGSCPWITTRWSKSAGDVWGRGPVLSVMPSVRTANYTIQLVLENAEMAVAGLYVYDDDNVFDPDNIVIQPGVFIPRSPGSKIDALETTSRFDVSQIVLQDERQNIRKGLFIDEYERDAKTPLSAFEVQQRSADIARDQSSVAGRLKAEHMDKVIARVVYILKKQGVIRADFPPIDGKHVKVIATGPLLRSQQQGEIQNFIQFTQVLNATYGPNASAAVLNAEESIEWLVKQFTIDNNLINSPDQMMQLLQGAGQVAQAAEQAVSPESMKLMSQMMPAAG